MAFTDLIKPGDKIDIRLLQQVENEERTGDTVKVFIPEDSYIKVSDRS